MAKRDYYEVLGVAENATEAQIKKAFRTLAKKYHPDANRNDPSAEAKFKEAGEAFEVLGDAAKRQQYDQMKRLGGRAGGFPGGGFPGGFPGGGYPGGADGGTFRGQTIDLSDLFGGGGGGRGMGDIFEHLFGGRNRHAEAPEDDRDIDVALDVPAHVAEKGGFAKFAVQRRGPCRTCDGSGAAPGHAPVTCSTCAGRGTVVQNRGGFSVSRTCPTCYGRGQVIEKPCPACAGEGLRFDERKLRVKIPAGAKAGQKLRLRGQGHAGTEGEPAGDLIVTLNVAAAAADNANKTGA